MLLAAALVEPIVGILGQGSWSRLMARQSSLFPFGEVVIARALLSSHPGTLSEFVSWALDKMPQKNEMNGGAIVSVMIEGRIVTTELPADEDWGHTLDNLRPALVLSHLAGKIEAEDRDGQLDAEHLTFAIWERLGKIDFPIVGTDVKTRPVHVINGGELLCGEAALVEPLTKSMADAIANPRVDVTKFARICKADADVFLAHRLRFAAQSMISSVDQRTAAAAREVADLLNGVGSVQ